MNLSTSNTVIRNVLSISKLYDIVNMNVSLKVGLRVFRFIFDCKYRFSSGSKYSRINGSHDEVDDNEMLLLRCCLPGKFLILSTVTISFSDSGSYSRLYHTRPMFPGGRSSSHSLSSSFIVLYSSGFNNPTVVLMPES